MKNDYRFLMQMAMKAGAHLAATKPHLTVVNKDYDNNSGELTMKTTNRPAPAAAPAVPLHQHGAFNDIEAAASFLDLGIDALQGIGVMLHPEMAAADEQMNFTRRSDASAVFRFFGEAMKESIRQINDSAFHLSADLRQHLDQ